MKKIIIIPCIIYTIFISFSALANIEKGKWNFVKDDDFCYIGSSPILSEMPEGKKRGDVFILVYRINKNPEKFIQITAGYNYKEGSVIKVEIDKKIHNFYSPDVDDSAWTDDDEKVIRSMKKGAELIVNGTSGRGTKTIDTYTLKGFTAAFNILSKDC